MPGSPAAEPDCELIPGEVPPSTPCEPDCGLALEKAVLPPLPPPPPPREPERGTAFKNI